MAKNSDYIRFDWAIKRILRDNGAGWGSVDENGEKDPDANYYNIWDEDYNIRRNRNVFDDVEE